MSVQEVTDCVHREISIQDGHDSGAARNDKMMANNLPSTTSDYATRAEEIRVKVSPKRRQMMTKRRRRQLAIWFLKRSVERREKYIAQLQDGNEELRRRIEDLQERTKKFLQLYFQRHAFKR